MYDGGSQLVRRLIRLENAVLGLCNHFGIAPIDGDIVGPKEPAAWPLRRELNALDLRVFNAEVKSMTDENRVRAFLRRRTNWDALLEHFETGLVNGLEDVDRRLDHVELSVFPDLRQTVVEILTPRRRD